MSAQPPAVDVDAIPTIEGPSVRPTGPAAAAVIAAGIGMVTMGGSALVAAALGRFDQALVEAGRLFVPGGEQLGRFGGQQVLALVAWLLSWAILHARWRRRNVSLTFTGVALVGCFVVTAILFWPPVTLWLVPYAR